MQRKNSVLWNIYEWSCVANDKHNYHSSVILMEII